MRMIVLLLFPLICAAQNARIDVEMVCTNSAQAIGLRASLNARLGIGKTNDVRNRDLTIRTNLSSFNVTLVCFAEDSSAAEQAWTRIQGIASLPNTTGFMRIHYCPEDGDHRFRNWAGCDADSRSNMREIRW